MLDHDHRKRHNNNMNSDMDVGCVSFFFESTRVNVWLCENVHAHDNSEGVAIKTSLNDDIQSRRSKLFEHQERDWSLFTVL